MYFRLSSTFLAYFKFRQMLAASYFYFNSFKKFKVLLFNMEFPDVFKRYSEKLLMTPFAMLKLDPS